MSPPARSPGDGSRPIRSGLKGVVKKKVPRSMVRAKHRGIGTRLVECDGCGWYVPAEEAHVLHDENGKVAQAICDDCWPDAEES